MQPRQDGTCEANSALCGLSFRKTFLVCTLQTHQQAASFRRTPGSILTFAMRWVPACARMTTFIVSVWRLHTRLLPEGVSGLCKLKSSQKKEPSSRRTPGSILTFAMPWVPAFAGMTTFIVSVRRLSARLLPVGVSGLCRLKSSQKKRIVIPANAGIHLDVRDALGPGVRRDDDLYCFSAASARSASSSRSQRAMQAQIQPNKEPSSRRTPGSILTFAMRWVPAFAGMTGTIA